MTVRGPDPKNLNPALPSTSGGKPTPSSAKPTAKVATPPAATPAATTASLAAGKNVAARAEDKKGPSTFADHTATLDIARNAKLTPAAVAGKRVADTVMQCIGSYDKSFLLDTDGLQAHVQQVATKFIAAADAAGTQGSVYGQLHAKFPGAQISLVGTGSLQAADQLVYLVRGSDNAVHKFVDVGGKPVEDARASDAIFMAADLTQPSAHMTVRVPDVKFLISPTLPPSYGVGRQIGVVMDQDLSKLKKNADDSVSPEMSHVYKETLPGDTKGEDGSALGVVYSDKREMKGKIVKYDGNGMYDVEVTQPDGTKKTVQQSESAIRSANDPMVYNLHGSTFDDVSINVDTDPSLKAFLAQAKTIADKDIPTTGTPEEIAKGQKQALVDLTVLCNKVMSYPDEDANTTDANSKKAMALMDSHSNWNPMKLGDLIDAGRGVCRHQAILMQLACQTAGIASRTVSATANDGQGNFRGYHAFLETTLDDGEQFLTDPTWYDAGPQNVNNYHGAAPIVNGQRAVGTKLWDTLYFNLERQVLPTWQDNTANEDHKAITFNESNTPVIDSSGAVVTPGRTPPVVVPGPAIDTKSVIQGIVNQLHGVRVHRNGDEARGDTYASAGDGLHAAKEYATAIAQGVDTSKAVWTKLAAALNQAHLSDAAAKAQKIADGLK